MHQRYGLITEPFPTVLGKRIILFVEHVCTHMRLGFKQRIGLVGSTQLSVCIK
jgi:hypothetical protein